MAYFAKISATNIVTQVIVADQEVIDSGLFGDPISWVETCGDTIGGIHYGPNGEPDGSATFRKNSASISYIYDPSRDAFYPPQPSVSWTLNEDTCLWESPVPMPNDDKSYDWNELIQTWVEIS